MAKRKKSSGGKSGTKSGGGREQNRALFLNRLAKILGVPARDAEALASIDLKSSIRINRLSPMGADKILSALNELELELEPIPWCADAFFLIDGKGVAVESDLFTGGHIYIQNASSLIPSLVLQPKANERLLDVCAAPGGKTAHLSALANGEVEILANDALREAKLKDVLATFHVPNVQTSAHPGQFIDRHVEGTFDRILLDAQCSGEGMVDLKRSDALKHWSLERIQKMAYLQQKMLSAAWKVLKPAGVLVYSTCTFGPEENEAPISRHLKHNDDAVIEPIELDVGGRIPGLKSWDGQTFNADLKNALRIQPSEFLEGFFVCRIKKREA